MSLTVRLLRDKNGFMACPAENERYGLIRELRSAAQEVLAQNYLPENVLKRLFWRFQEKSVTTVVHEGSAQAHEVTLIGSLDRKGKLVERKPVILRFSQEITLIAGRSDAIIDTAHNCPRSLKVPHITAAIRTVRQMQKSPQ